MWGIIHACTLTDKLDGKNPDQMPDYRMVEQVATEKTPTKRRINLVGA